ncbi:MAG: xanthine dehydrogenase family protein molybdopterin-binding subunit [Chloroflexi bacterium]|nr:xanthine dehydrogenase family protein molybdopterin-binding subunit [Chloroflexota bacterium]
MSDAVARVTGTIPYTVNLQLPETLVVKVLRSPLPHARLVRLDASAAEAMDGVVAVLTSADLGQPGGPSTFSGVLWKDQPVVADDKVRYIGEPVAAVAATTEEIAEAALTAIELGYEELPAVYDAVAATKGETATVHDKYPDNIFLHAKLRHGDIAAGFAAADVIIEESYTSPIAQHVTMEPHVTAAQWHNDQLTVWTATQAPYLVQAALAELFALDSAQVRVIVPPLGGGYGGKGHLRLEPLVSALAWKVGGRPVKLVLTRPEEFVTVTKHAATIHIKSGVRRDGAFTARQVTIYWNGGAYADASPSLVRAGMVRAIGPYRIANVWVDSYGVYTNLPPAGAFRGAMASQGAWAYESHIDTIAHRLGLNPLEYRLAHLLQDGDHFATGEILHDVHFSKCLKTAAGRLNQQATAPAHPAPTRRRGRGLAVMMKSTMPTSRSECRLSLNSAGQITLYTSTVEMGQGTHTALSQITAAAMEMPPDRVVVVGPDTARTPFDSSTNASRGTTMMGQAIVDGAQKLKEKLIDAAVPLLEHAAEELAAASGHVIVKAQPERCISYGEIVARNHHQSIEAMGTYQTRGGLDPETGQGLATPHWHQGAGACQVEVDTETGKVTVLRYVGTAWAGRVVNPTLAKLQNDGNVIFGLGPAVMEEVLVDAGQIVNPNLSDYLIPSFLDIPTELETVALESEGGEIHGIGEMTLPCVAPAIANAVYDAVGIRIYDLPITAEKVLKALQHEQ